MIGAWLDLNYHFSSEGDINQNLKNNNFGDINNTSNNICHSLSTYFMSSTVTGSSQQLLLNPDTHHEFGHYLIPSLQSRRLVVR